MPEIEDDPNEAGKFIVLLKLSIIRARRSGV